MKTSTVPNHRKRRLARVLFGFSIVSSIILLSAGDAARGQVRRVVFEGAQPEHKWVLTNSIPVLHRAGGRLPRICQGLMVTGVDEPVISTTENYNIAILDVTDRPYPEMERVLRTVHKRLLAVQSDKARPFNRRPRASEAGTPSYRLSDAF